MNSPSPWMKAGTPDVVTVIVGAPTGPPPAAPATPKTEPRSCLRSGGISWGGDSPELVSVWLLALASGEGDGPEAEKEKEEEEEVWEEEEENEDDEEVEDGDDVTVWAAV